METKTLHKGKFIDLNETTYYDNEVQKERSWEWAQRSNNVETVTLNAIHTPTKKLVVIKEFRIPLQDYVWSLPAGIVEYNDHNGQRNIVSTAIRELKEETGLDLISIYNISSKLYNSPGLTDESTYMIECSCGGSLSTEHQEATEDIQPFLLSPKDISELFISNEKISTKGYLAMQNFLLGKNY